MACSKSLTINVESVEGDMPLDQAIFMSGINKIIGVRGRWIYKFNSDTGELEASGRWCTGANGVASMAAIGSTLYVSGYATSIRRVTGNFPYTSDALEVVRFNTSSMETDLVISDISNYAGFNYNPNTNPGFRDMISVDNYLVFTTYADIVSVDPTDVAGTWDGFSNFQQYTSFSDISHNASLDLICQTRANNQELYWYDSSDIAGGSTNASAYSDPHPTDSSSFCACGTTMSSANSCGYSVEGRGNFIKHDLSQFGTGLIPTRRLSILDTDATPVRIKCSPLNGKIYVPCGRTDTVYVFDPVAYASDETPGTPLTGFDDPIDVVFTGSKAFAVQNGRVGLKEIV